MLGHEVDVHHALIGQVPNLVEARHVRDRGAAADVEEERFGFEYPCPHANRARALETGVSFDVGKSVGFAEPAHEPVGRVAHDRVLARFHRRHVDADRRADAHTEVRCAARDVRGSRAGDQGLGRNAAVVDARAADALALDDGGLASRLGEPHRERWPGLTRADDDGVVALVHVVSSTGGAYASAPRRGSWE